MKKVGLVDIGLSNLGSMWCALSDLGAEVIPIRTVEDFSGLDRVVLPGVGAFSEAMNRLDSAALVQVLQHFARSGRPMLGVCLGMQLLANTGHEGGVQSGLSLIQGTVRPMQRGSDNVRIPHVGWNEVVFTRSHSLTRGLGSKTDFYFVHGFALDSYDTEQVLGFTEHGASFPSFVVEGNVAGVQFHPEKSHIAGIEVLRNFLDWAP